MAISFHLLRFVNYYFWKCFCFATRLLRLATNWHDADDILVSREFKLSETLPSHERMMQDRNFTTGWSPTFWPYATLATFDGTFPWDALRLYMWLDGTKSTKDYKIGTKEHRTCHTGPACSTNKPKCFNPISSFHVKC